MSFFPTEIIIQCTFFFTQSPIKVEDRAFGFELSLSGRGLIGHPVKYMMCNNIPGAEECESCDESLFQLRRKNVQFKYHPVSAESQGVPRVSLAHI